MTRPRLYQLDFDTATVSTTPTTLGAIHGFVRVDTTAGNITLNLPAAASSTDRAYYVIKVAGANDIIIDPNGAETINGAATYTISTQWEGALVVCNGTTWTAFSGGASGHAAVTLDADAAVLLDLTGQELGLDTQTANTVFAGPTTGAANEPTFRSLVSGDLPAINFDDLADVNTGGVGMFDTIRYNGGWIDVTPLLASFLQDVYISGVSDGDVLTWVAGAPGQWENQPPATPSLDLNDLADVDTTGTNTGDVIYNNAGTWEDYPMEVGTAIGNDGSQIQIGDIASGDYVGISSSNGETRLYGNARQWDDVQVTVVIRNTGATTRDPTFTQWFTDGAGSRGVYVYGFTDEAINEKELFFTVQMTHKQDPTAGIHMHVHWIGDSTADPAKVRWGLEYTWKSPYEVFGNTTIVYADTVEGGATGVTQYKHNITEFTVLNPDTTQDDLSSIIIGRIFRDSSDAADTYTGGVAGLLAIDAHVLVDSFGSVDEYTKYEDLGGILLAEDSSELLTEAGYQLLEE